MEINRNDRFLIDNYHDIEYLMEAKREFERKLHLEVREVKSLCALKGLHSEGENSYQCSYQSIWKDVCLFHEYNLSGYTIVLDLYIKPSGWFITLFGRNPDSTEHLKKILAFEPLSKELLNFGVPYDSHGSSNYSLNTYELSSNLEDIAKDLLDWSNILIETDKNYNAKNKETDPDS